MSQTMNIAPPEYIGERQGGEMAVSPRTRVDRNEVVNDAFIRTRLHKALGLTADQAIAGEVIAYNTWHSSRDGRRLPGGEMVVRVTVAGIDVNPPPVRQLEIRDGERCGLDETAITELGRRALGTAMVERIVL